MKVFLDANILFSASKAGSATRMLFDAAVTYADICITNPHAFEEAQRNIQNKRSAYLPDFHGISRQCVISHAFYLSSVIDLPLQDVPILAGAIGSRCTHLWTGDKKHFGQFYGQTFHAVMIVSSIILADILIERGWNPDV